MTLENEIKETGDALLNALNKQIEDINKADISDVQKKQLIAMAEGIKKSVGNMDIENIKNILNFANNVTS